jgi:bifunctional DNA-binding transcriptional regulator/antitoxin component of YhaV-PrlF toxin-antitoxin module
MKKRIIAPEIVGQTTLTGKNQVSLPARAVKLLEWNKGDQLSVHVVGDDMVLLLRPPKDWAGQFGDVFGTHEENLTWLEEERASWDREP